MIETYKKLLEKFIEIMNDSTKDTGWKMADLYDLLEKVEGLNND